MSTVLQTPPAPAQGQRSRPAIDRLPLAAVLLTAVPVALVVAAASGALEPVLLADAGPVVRFAVPVVRVLHDLAAALTIGLLLVAAFLAPEGRRTVRRETAAAAAALSALVWAVSAGAGVVLAFADSAGVPPSAPGFWSDLATNAWPLELTRLLTVGAGMALLVVPAAWLARTRGALAWTFALALAALLPLSLGGHASGTAGHVQAMTALLFHLLGVTLWVGGLLAVLLLRPVLGAALPVVVRRYSVVALWGFLTVGLSGVLFALVEVDDLGDLTSAYWLIIWAKVGALVLLGAFGARQRRAVIARGVDRPAVFARLALTELTVMGAAVGLGVALSRTPPPAVAGSGGPVLELTGYPLPATYQPSVWLTAWQTSWLFLTVALLALGLYAAGAARLRRRGDRWPVGRTACWVVGWAVFVYATNAAPAVYGRVMFSMHMVMHMLVMMAVPILLVLATPVTLALRSLPVRKDATLGPREVLLAVVHSRWVSALVNPVVSAVIFFASLVGFYWSGALQWALTTHTGHVLMVVHFMLTGYAFVWSLIGTDPGPPKWPAPLRLVVLFATVAAHAFFGMALMAGSWLLAPGFFKAVDVPWVPDLLADQRLAGSIAWGVGEMPTIALALLVARDWLRSDSRDAVRSDRRADRDDDAELAAYNARLQELARGGNDRRPT